MTTGDTIGGSDGNLCWRGSISFGEVVLGVVAPLKHCGLLSGVLCTLVPVVSCVSSSPVKVVSSKFSSVPAC